MKRTAVTMIAIAAFMLFAAVAFAGCAGTQGSSESHEAPAPAIRVPVITFPPLELESAPPAAQTQPRRSYSPSQEKDETPSIEGTTPTTPAPEPSSSPSSQPCPS